MKGRAIDWSRAELAWLQANCTLPIGEYHAGFVAAFGRTDVSAANVNSLRKRRGWRTGRTGHFERGQVSWNKGKSMPVHPNSAATQFRKGNAPANRVPLGTERIRTDGYIEISVPQPNPYTGAPCRFVMKHVHLWEQINGPVPKGHCLKALDGDRTNTDPANWEAIPRGILPRLNGGRATKLLPYDTASPEVKPVLMAAAKLAHRAKHLRGAGA